MGNDILNRKYEPQEFEENVYQNWEKKGYFHSVVDETKEPYTIVMPPPNITGKLHMGHALDNTIQDILIRYKKMAGFNADFEAEKVDSDKSKIVKNKSIELKPMSDEEAILQSAFKTKRVITIEEHSVIGGLGSAVADVISAKNAARVLKIGVEDIFGQSGSGRELIKEYGLDSESIQEKAKNFLKEK